MGNAFIFWKVALQFTIRCIFDYLNIEGIHSSSLCLCLAVLGKSQKDLELQKKLQKAFKRPWMSVRPGFIQSIKYPWVLIGWNAQAVTFTGEVLCNLSFTGLLHLKTSLSPAKPGTSMKLFCVHRLVCGWKQTCRDQGVWIKPPVAPQVTAGKTTA